MNQKGQILIMVLVLIAFGALLLTPALALASTSLIAIHNSVDRQKLFYSADAGIEEALWRFKDFDKCIFIPKLSQTNGVPYFLAPINGIETLTNEIDCLIYNDIEKTYRITSIASSHGISTKIECYTTAKSIFFTNGAVSRNEIDNKGLIQNPDGSPADYKEHWKGFPTVTELQNFYKPQAQLIPQYPNSQISIINTKIDHILGSYYGGDLEIKNDGTRDGGTLILNGIVYITGNLTTGSGNGKSQTINLNGYVIYCTGDIDIVQSCTFCGSGTIISENNISFKPNIKVGSENDFIFVMSVKGTIIMQPGGNFYGSVAAGGEGKKNISITIQPGNIITLIPLGSNKINFPAFVSNSRWPVMYWQIK